MKTKKIPLVILSRDKKIYKIQRRNNNNRGI